MIPHKYWMAKALAQARTAFDYGEFPVGCIIVCGEVVVARGSRQGTTAGKAVFSEVDHAEIRALRELESRKVPVAPEACTIYATMEPCLMCFGAILISGIRNIVYACEDPMGGGTGCDRSGMTPLYRDAGVQIQGGVCREESLDLFYRFFSRPGNTYWQNSLLERYIREQKAAHRK